MKEANEYYELALSEHPNQPEIVASVANFYLRHGHSGAALPMLRQLVIRNLMSPHRSGPVPGVRWLGMVAQPDARYSQFQTAMELIDQNLNENRQATGDDRGVKADLLVKAQLLASRPELRSKRKRS